jgi:predicted small secreted protein
MMIRILLIVALTGLTACQTVKGVAADVKNGTDTVVGWMGG